MIGLCWGAEQPQQSRSRNTVSTPGKKLFAGNCSGCHGLDAKGGDRAPSIASGSNAARLSESELKHIVTNGVSGSGMPPFGFLGDAQINSVVEYLRSLQGRGATAQMPGDPQRGSELFFGKAQCSECHMAAGKGGFIASDLTGYGSGRSPAEIRQALTVRDKDSDRIVKQAVVVTREGQKYAGVIRTEDNFSLVLQTRDGGFVSMQKTDLASVSYEENPLMPEYGSKLSSHEIDDIVSYLMSLKPHIDPAAAEKNAKRHWEDD